MSYYCPHAGTPKSIIEQNCVNQKWIIPGKHYFAGLIPSNEALSREHLYPNEHFTGIIGSLSVSVVPVLTAVPVAFGRLE